MPDDLYEEHLQRVEPSDAFASTLQMNADRDWETGDPC
jgi:hypothetical protein